MRYFTHSEFASPDAPGSGNDMCNDFLQMIDNARDIAGIPFKINSGMRTIAHNRSIGSKDTSSHIIGCAADIHCNNSLDRSKIVAALIQAGFRRLGIAETFVHCDCDERKPNAIWLY
tara:strand:- start:19463 stop:19813 length:351 start_codon:yes stop_codon:yes gene_type:complete